jgi:hypothetical protein
MQLLTICGIFFFFGGGEVLDNKPVTKVNDQSMVITDEDLTSRYSQKL